MEMTLLIQHMSRLSIKNVLGKDANTSGLIYWLGQLNSDAETRYEVLLGFAESAENKALFTEMRGFG